jgi:hypothetical protein
MDEFIKLTEYVKQIVRSAEADSNSDGENIPRNSGHFRYSPEKRRQIVEEYLEARKKGRIKDKDVWAQARYGIAGRTLWNYEQEYKKMES